MRTLHKIMAIVFLLILTACGPTPPSEAEGWELIEDLDTYVKREFYSKDDQLTKNLLTLHEGTWSYPENPEIAVVINNGKIYLGLFTSYTIYEITDYELKSNKYTSKEQNYEEGDPIFTLILDPTDVYGHSIPEVRIWPFESNKDVVSKPDYSFSVVVDLLNGDTTPFFVERSNIDYILMGYHTENNQSQAPQEKNNIDEKEESPSKKETAGQRAKREAEARREQEARRRESKRREEEAARQEELEEQRKQEEEAIRLEEEQRITEEREQQARIDESIKLINNIVNKHLGSFLNGEYELSFISSYKEIIQIVPNSNAYNGNIDSFFQNVRLTEEEPTDEWIKLTNIMINLSKELSKEFPDQNLQIQLTDTNHTIGYLILENGEVTHDFAYY